MEVPDFLTLMGHSCWSHSAGQVRVRVTILELIADMDGALEQCKPSQNAWDNFVLVDHWTPFQRTASWEEEVASDILDTSD